MTRDEIIRMAAEVEREISGHDFPHSDEFIQWCERFAALVSAAEREKFKVHAAALVRDARHDATEREREACAKVCIEIGATKANSDDGLDIADLCAATIRARGEK